MSKSPPPIRFKDLEERRGDLILFLRIGAEDRLLGYVVNHLLIIFIVFNALCMPHFII